jgi:FAD/FMN-containing dehydrogenase
MYTKQKTQTRREFLKLSAMTAIAAPLLDSCGLGSPKSSFDQEAIKKFKEKFSGQIILPGTAEYETRRWSRIINPRLDKHPSLIAACKKEEDIVRGVEFAKEYQLEISVRSGNHSNMGWGTCDNGIVIDLSQMKGISVNADKKTAVVTTGVTAEELLAATVPYGLAPVLGECGSVGSGLALGGGLGYLVGKYGATCDNLISANIITAEAKIRKADALTNDDLFWAIRGGGGNFGIASTFEYKLYPVKEMLGGTLFYSRDKAADIQKFFSEFMSTAPDELQAETYLSRDKYWMDFVYYGNLNEGERLLNKLRTVSKPEQDSVKRRPFSEIYTMSEDSSAPSKFNSEKGTYLEQLSDEVFELVREQLAKAPQHAGAYFNFSHYVHGEICRVPLDATAFELRKPGAVHLAFWLEWQDSADTNACLSWHNELFDRLQPYSGNRMYANYMSTPGGANAKAVFGKNFSRLAQVKKKYDPDNIFHLNPNILPAP